MRKLLKADFFRIIKDSAFLVAVILSAALPFLLIAMYSAMGAEETGAIGLLELLIGPFNLQSFITKVFSITDNMGILIPIFIVIIFAKEFKNGTIRNKIVAGHSRNKIFLSNFISMLLLSYFLILVRMVFTTIYTLIFFGVGEFDFSIFIADFGFGMLTFTFFIVAVFFIVMLIRSSGGSIGLTIGLFIVGSFLIYAPTFEVIGANLSQASRIIFLCLPHAQIGYYTYRSVLMLVNYEIIIMICSCFAWIILLFVLGWVKFRKVDLK